MDDSQLTTAALRAPPSARELIACWDDQAQRFELSGTSLVIGRGNTCDVQLPHASVSRTHARLSFGDQGIFLEDLGSANGARVDGVRVEGQAPVSIGAIMEIGAVRLLVRSRETASPSPMAEVRRLVERVSASPVSLIILGETGVGKEVLAEEIHARSGRGGPLVKINCAGLAASLLESELFGHERGAFTGAVQPKAGLIESANGGTLLLDELGEMPDSTQPKLLRVLESREVRRVGALRPNPIDVRFISATHRDPRTLAAMGKFREDLVFRLNGLTIRIPPLRERREEIPKLADGFLHAACQRAARATPVLSEGARVLLESYRWPGNVRELRSVMDRVALLCEGERVLVEHLILDPSPVAQVSVPAPARIDDERERIIKALADAGGNLASAAKSLNVTARVLGYRMDKLGLPRPRKR
jgi:two-component system response regulator AtoC